MVVAACNAHRVLACFCRHMPLVLDEVLTILINIVGDLSRTQRLDVYEWVL